MAELFLILVNSFYFYIYVISGITDLAVQIPIEENIIHFSLNLDKMIYVNMGIYALNIFVALYDLILSIVSPVEIKGEYTEKDYDKERTIEKYGRYLDR